MCSYFPVSSTDASRSSWWFSCSIRYSLSSTVLCLLGWVSTSLDANLTAVSCSFGFAASLEAVFWFSVSPVRLDPLAPHCLRAKFSFRLLPGILETLRMVLGLFHKWAGGQEGLCPLWHLSGDNTAIHQSSELQPQVILVSPHSFTFHRYSATKSSWCISASGNAQALHFSLRPASLILCLSPPAHSLSLAK